MRRDGHVDHADRLHAEISQLVWAHPSITHSHYKSPQGKVFTLSPWSVNDYWEMTRVLDTDEYELT